MIPVRTPFFLPYFYPSLLWRMDSQKKELYLTFDDGPVSGPTDFVLETLAKHECLATFFCIGDNIRKYPEVFARISANGHSVANHTYNHLNGWTTPHEQYITNVHQCTEEIHRQTPDRLPSSKMLFRPPYGKITLRAIRALHAYRIVMWDVITKDFDTAIRPETCLKTSILASRPGSIIVFHDSFKAEGSLTYVLPRFIEHFKSRGFEFKSLTI
jgi:peptidoglycan-N-acetylglucosamine deacetylase